MMDIRGRDIAIRTIPLLTAVDNVDLFMQAVTSHIPSVLGTIRSANA